MTFILTRVFSDALTSSANAHSSTIEVIFYMSEKLWFHISLCLLDPIPRHHRPHGPVAVRQLRLPPLDALLPHLLRHHLHRPLRQLLLPDLPPPAAQARCRRLLLLQGGQGHLQRDLQRTEQGSQRSCGDGEQRGEAPGELRQEEEERKSQTGLEEQEDPGRSRQTPEELGWFNLDCAETR